MSWFSSDLEAIEEFVGWGLIMIIDALFLSTVAIYRMLTLDLILTLVAVIPMTALIVWGFLVEKTMNTKWEERQKQFDTLYDFTQENFTGIRVVKAFVREDYEKEKFNDASGAIYKLGIAAEKVLSYNNPFMMLTVNTCILPIFLKHIFQILLF